MKEFAMRAHIHSPKNYGRWLSTVILALSACSLAVGQGQAPPGAGPPPNINPRAEDRSRQLAEGRLRSAEMDAASESEKEKYIRAAIVHMKEDFTRIQVLRNDIARNLLAKKPLDYKLISDQTSEIHKCASRLNIYILAHPPEVKDESAKDPTIEQMVSSLVKLCKLIDSFTENPALKNVATVDVKHLDKTKEDKAKADKDLLEIIKLSGILHKQADNPYAAN